MPGTLTAPPIDTCPTTANTDAAPSPQTGVVNVGYVVARDALSSVFHSQVLTPASMHGPDVSVKPVVFSPIGHLLRQPWRGKMQALRTRARDEMNLDLTILPSPPARARRLWDDAWLLRRWAMRTFRSQPAVLHCRNIESTSVALRAVGHLEQFRVVLDCRGDEATEYVHMRRLNLADPDSWPQKVKQGYAERLEREADVLRRADHITCVSQAMVDQFIERYGIERSRFTVGPCCPNVDAFLTAAPDRDAVRRELGIDDRFVVTYCGSLKWYQYPEAGIRLFQMMQQIRDDAHLLAITTEPEKMSRLLADAGIAEDRLSVMSAPPSGVPRLLVASDLAMLLRDDSAVNRVASPVKFGEYLSAGSPVVLTPHVGDFSQTVVDHRLGMIVDIDADDDTVRRQIADGLNHLQPGDIDACRDRCREYATEHLSWRRHIPVLSQLYHELTRRPTSRARQEVDNPA